MTKRELTKCYRLNQEIEDLENTLQGLEGKEFKEINLSGMPHSSEVGDPVGNLAVQKAEIHKLISLKYEECVIARTRIERFINEVEDPDMRRILRIRHIEGKTWRTVAERVGYTERHVQRIHAEYLRNMS